MSGFAEVFVATEEAALAYFSAWDEALGEDESDAWYDEAMADIETTGEVRPERAAEDPLEAARSHFALHEEWRGIWDTHISLLWALIDGKPHDLKHHQLEEMITEEGRSLQRFSAPLARALRGLSDARVAELGARWAALEELGMDAATGVELLESLKEMADLAERSALHVYLYASA